MSNQGHIVVVRNGGIGDTVLLAPVLHGLRSAFPDRDILLLGRYERVSLLVGPSFATRARSSELPGIHTLYGTQPLLPAETHDLFAKAYLVLWYGEDREGRLGENLRKLCSGAVVLCCPGPRGTEHAGDHLLRVLDWLGVPRPQFVPPLELSAALPPDLRELLSWREGKLAVAHPGASHPGKRVRPEVWAEVLHGLSRNEEILPVVLSGPGEDDLGIAVCAQACDLEPLLVSNRPLMDVAALLKSAHLFLGHDSGITHLAASVGSPTVAVFRSTDPKVWAPQGERVRIVQVEDEPGAAHLILSEIRL